MSEQHTQGHMKAGVSLVGGVEHFTVVPHGSEQTVVAMCGLTGAKDEPESIANTRRIAGCWNACDGIPTDMLEAMPDGPAALLPMYAQLEAQRDALLAAARTMSAALDDLIAKKPALAGVMSGSTTMGNQRVEFRAVIKQVEAAL